MTLTEFKKIHRNDSPAKKLDLLCETMWNSGTARVNAETAKALRNQKDYRYWINEHKAMMRRSDWLYQSLKSHLEKDNENLEVW